MSTPQSSSIETACAVVGSLIAGGVTRIAYCPGSRNAPLAYTLAAAESAGQLCVETFSDERSAGFWAVGASIGGGRVPVAVMTTSGTAVAELHAALVEARYQGLPVIAVTADRPHELRGVGASQTIDQEGIFGRTVLASVSLPADATWNDACHQTHRLVACAQGRGGDSGPVHLNVAFRDPLVPTVPVEVPHAPAPAIVPGGRVLPEWDEVVASDLATLVVAGDSASPVVARVAAIRRIPVIGEPSSGVWNSPTAISHGPLVAPLIHDGVKQVVVTGRPTLSRPVQRLINDPGIRKVVVAPRDPWTDCLLYT